MNKDARNLLVFILATFLATWSAYFAIILNGWSPYTLPGLAFFLIGGSAPSWVGVLMVLITYDKSGRRDYFRRSFSFAQIKLAWWAVIVLIFPLIMAVAVTLDLWLGGSKPGMTQLKDLAAQPWLIPLAILMSFLSGPWSEEFGWRGYSLDPLMKSFGNFAGALILGLVWGVWHLPLFFMPQTWHGQMGFRLEGFWSFMLFSIGLSCIMAWVYLSTNRSILTGFMLHLASNFTGNLLMPYSDRVLDFRTMIVLVLGLALGLWMQDRSKPFRFIAAAKENQ